MNNFFQLNDLCVTSVIFCVSMVNQKFHSGPTEYCLN